MRICGVAGVLILVCVAAGGWPEPAQGPPGAGGLDWVPTDALAFSHLNGAALWNGPVLGEVQKRLPPNKVGELNRFFEEIQKSSGIDPKQVTSLTMFLQRLDLRTGPTVAIVATSDRPFDQERIRQRAAPGPRQRHGDVEFFPMPFGPSGTKAGAFPAPNVFLMGDAEALGKAIDQHRRPADGPLAGAIRAARGRDVALHLRLTDDLRDLILNGVAAGGPGPEGDRAVAASVLRMPLQMRHVSLHLDVKTDLNLDLQVEAVDERAAGRFRRLFESYALALDVLAHSLGEVARRFPSSAWPKELADLLPLVGRAAEEGQVTREGNRVRFTMSVKGGGPAVSGAVAALASRSLVARDRMLRASNLRQIAIAFHNFHVDYERLPAQAMMSRDGKKSLLSWRVTILPYLEQDNLFKQFRLDEPWDSEHNKQLIPKMPNFYRVPGAPDPGPGKTYLQVFVGPEKPAAGKTERFKPMFRRNDPRGITLGNLTVLDGTSNTLLVVEGGEPVIWTKPDDLFIEHDEAPLPKLGCVPAEDDFAAVYGDAHVNFLRRSLPNRGEYEKLLRQLIGYSDGMNEDVRGIEK